MTLGPWLGLASVQVPLQQGQKQQGASLKPYKAPLCSLYLRVTLGAYQ